MLQRIASLLRINPPIVDNRGLLMSSGATVPTDGTDGYQSGCIFQHTDGSTGTVLYVNEGSVTSCDFNAIESGTISGPIVLDGTTTDDAIQVTGTYERVLELSSYTPGTTTDGVIARVGSGIGTSALAMPDGSRGLALYMRNTGSSGTLTGIRLRCVSDPSSSANSIDSLLVQTSVVASKNATTINSGFFEFIPKGTNTITTGRVLLLNADSAASQTMTTQIIAHLRVHTRGDETITNDEVIRIENEAVGGNGRQLDSAIRVIDTNLSGGIIGYTAVFDVSAKCQRVFDLSSITTGSTTDGVIMRVGSGIGTSALAMPDGSRGLALYMRNTGTSGTLTGIRLRCVSDASSGANNIDNFLCQASVVANKNATTVNSGFFEFIPKGTNTIGTARGLLVNIDSAASVTVSTQQTVAHLRLHTRGDETMSGTDEMLRLENEAVGGNGRQIDSFIRAMATNISGGIKAAGYLIDGGTGTTLLGTAVLRLPDDGTVASSSDTGAGNADGADFSGFLKVVIGTTTKYIPLIAAVPSSQFA